MKLHFYIVLGLVAAAFLIRFPTFHEPCMNVDEASNAAYVVYFTQEGQPIWKGIYPALLYLYRLAYILGGDYNNYVLRLLGALIVGLTAALLYGAGWRVWRDARWAALWGAAYIILMISRRWEGYAINNELLAAFFLSAALWAMLQAADRRWPLAWALLAGIGIGAATQAKSQATVMGLAFAAAAPAILWVREQRRRPGEPAASRLKHWLPLTLGVEVAMAAPAYLIFRLQWILEGRWRQVATSSPMQVYQSHAGYIEGGIPQEGSRIALLLENLIVRPLPDVAWAMALIMAVWVVGGWVMRGGLGSGSGGMDDMDRMDAMDTPGGSEQGKPLRRAGLPIALILAIWLGFALLAVSLGFRFFAHYYIFALPAVAGLAVELARRMWMWDAEAARETGRPLTTRRRALIGLALVFVADSVAISYWRDLTGVITFDHELFRATAEVIIERTDDDDRIYVWGYSPDLYLYTRLTPASAQVVPQHIVRDYGQNDVPQLNEGLLRRLFADFEAHPPKLFIDVSAASFSLAELRTKKKSQVYDIAQIPMMEQFLEENFDVLGRIGTVVVYQWKEK